MAADESQMKHKGGSWRQHTGFRAHSGLLLPPFASSGILSGHAAPSDAKLSS